MAAKDDNARPIIIKKKKKGGHDEHHGGQWKVAYADFVTAMMAFFLMLWLLNATTEEQRDGIADYFSPTSISKSTSGGGGMLAGQTIAKDGALVHNRAPMGVNIKLPPAQDLDAPGNQGTAEQGDDGAEQARREARREAERQRFEKAAEALRQALESSPELERLKDHLQVDQTAEGLRIRIVDKLNESMFKSGSAEPLPRTRQLLAQVSRVVANMPNDVAIKGHTDAVQFSSDNGYGNWELSSDRANASRRILVSNGLPPDRVSEVTGRADQDLLTPDDPDNPRNRRISIVLLREEPLAAANEAGASDNREAPQGPPDDRQLGPSIIGTEGGNAG